MESIVRFRLVRADDIPATNPDGGGYIFGLQDTKQQIVAGTRQPDGTLVFDFALRAKTGSDPKHPIFLGAFASGPVHDRFVYLSWRSVTRSDYINRVKARLSAIDWKLVRASQKADRPLMADMTGWTPGDARKQVRWTLA